MKILCAIFTGHHWKQDGATDESIWFVCKYCGWIMRKKKV